MAKITCDSFTVLTFENPKRDAWVRFAVAEEGKVYIDAHAEPELSKKDVRRLIEWLREATSAG